MNLNSLESTKSVTASIIEHAYKEQVQVGRDTIDKVEYLIINHSGWFDKKENKTLKDRLENIWDILTTPYYKVKYKFSDTYWKIRYGFQRMFKGYDAMDTFETYGKFIERYTKIIQDIRNHHYGYPGDITEEEWNNILDDMLYHLYYMDEIHVEDELEKEVPDNWSADSKLVYDIMKKHKNEFFELFSRYFYTLWD